jgi:hypothetical protein
MAAVEDSAETGDRLRHRAHPCKKRKDGTPSVEMAHARIIESGLGALLPSLRDLVPISLGLPRTYPSASLRAGWGYLMPPLSAGCGGFCVFALRPGSARLKPRPFKAEWLVAALKALRHPKTPAWLL